MSSVDSHCAHESTTELITDAAVRPRVQIKENTAHNSR